MKTMENKEIELLENLSKLKLGKYGIGEFVGCNQYLNVDDNNEEISLNYYTFVKTFNDVKSLRDFIDYCCKNAVRIYRKNDVFAGCSLFQTKFNDVHICAPRNKFNGDIEWYKYTDNSKKTVEIHVVIKK